MSKNYNISQPDDYILQKMYDSLAEYSRTYYEEDSDPNFDGLRRVCCRAMPIMASFIPKLDPILKSSEYRFYREAWVENERAIMQHTCGMQTVYREMKVNSAFEFMSALSIKESLLRTTGTNNNPDGEKQIDRMKCYGKKLVRNMHDLDFSAAMREKLNNLFYNVVASEMLVSERVFDGVVKLWPQRALAVEAFSHILSAHQTRKGKETGSLWALRFT